MVNHVKTLIHRELRVWMFFGMHCFVQNLLSPKAFKTKLHFHLGFEEVGYMIHQNDIRPMADQSTG